MEIKVIKWSKLKKTKNIKTSAGCIMGGFFYNGMRWKDYIKTFSNEVKPYLFALKKEIILKKIRYSGEQHQCGSNGVPVFNDNTRGCFSFRAWGDLMAAIWSTEEDNDYSYMDFYC